MFRERRELFRHNQHGHTVFSIDDLILSGAEELELFKVTNHHATGWARQMLMSASYDAQRWVEDRRNEIVFLPGRGQIPEALFAEAKMFGYGETLANIVPRIRKAFSDEEIERMGFSHIAALHPPIMIDGQLSILCTYPLFKGGWIDTNWYSRIGEEGNADNGHNAFAFFTSQY